jgi:hypothetical protein
MLRTSQNGHYDESESLGEQQFAESPFADPRRFEQEDAAHESSVGESYAGQWEFTSPFLPGESSEAAPEVMTPEAGAFSEITAELKDTLFREALEQLADEALEAHPSLYSGEYGDRETRDLAAERVLTEHFQPLATQAEALLDRFFERLEGYEAESLTDSELERISDEVLPMGSPMTPASEQFLGGLLRKARGLVSGAVNLAKRGVQGAINLAGKGLSAIGKLALGPLLKPLKMLGKFLLQHVVKFALNQLPPALRPLAQKLSDRLFRAIGETHEGEGEAQEQGESETPAAADASRLEAEFDVHAAQLLFTSDEAELDHLVSSYGEGEARSFALEEIDDARARLVKELAGLQPGENVQPVMEQFVQAIWPAVKVAISVIGRPKVVKFLGDLLSRLIKPLIGADAGALLAPAIADAGLRIFGFETAAAEPRVIAAEALAATVEETVHAVAALPSHVLDHETLLSDAVHEAFENAAASYFPNSVIKPELRESAERNGMWSRKSDGSGRKRYAKYSDAVPVEIPQRLAGTIDSFGNRSLHDHLRDHHGSHDGRPFKGKMTLYQALPGARGSTIARAEGFPVSQLHPLTPQAAGALLGPGAALGMRSTPPGYLHTPQRLHVNQRLYRIEPQHHHRHHPHMRSVHSELSINLLRGEIRLWLYLSEPMCQRIAADLSKGSHAALAFAHVKRLLRRTTHGVRTAAAHRHLPPGLIVVADAPSLDRKAPHWLQRAGLRLGAKIDEWARLQVAQYLQNNVQEFKRECASHHDGVTLRITMTRVPGLDGLRLMSQGKQVKDLESGGWPAGSPAFQVVLRAGYHIHRLRT